MASWGCEAGFVPQSLSVFSRKHGLEAPEQPEKHLATGLVELQHGLEQLLKSAPTRQALSCAV